MTGWPTKPLLDTADLTATRVGAFTGQRPYVSTGDVNEEGIVAVVPVTFDDRPSRADLTAREGDVLFARMQATNKVAIVTKENEQCLWSTGFAALRPRPGTNPRWLAYWLASPLFNARKDVLCTGATQKAITNDGIRELEIPLPPASEQGRIVAILDEADALRRLRAMASHRTSDIAQALFGELIRSREPEWRSSRLETLCTNVEDCPHSTPTYAEGKTPFPCVRSSDIQDGRFDWSTTKYVDESEYKERVRRLVPRFGDVVYCREGARLGNAAIIPKDVSLCLGQRMMLFRADPSIATPEFIWALLLSALVRDQVASSTGGAASPHINIRDIRSFTVPIPPLGIQQSFSAQVSQDWELETAQGASRQRLNDLFQSLLDRAFQGDL